MPGPSSWPRRLSNPVAGTCRQNSAVSTHGCGPATAARSLSVLRQTANLRVSDTARNNARISVTIIGVTAEAAACQQAGLTVSITQWGRRIGGPIEPFLTIRCHVSVKGSHRRCLEPAIDLRSRRGEPDRSIGQPTEPADHVRVGFSRANHRHNQSANKSQHGPLRCRVTSRFQHQSAQQANELRLQRTVVRDPEMGG